VTCANASSIDINTAIIEVLREAVDTRTNLNDIANGDTWRHLSHQTDSWAVGVEVGNITAI
jgi:hypothetical protein